MLSNYDLEELIGCGTYGNVYLARCKSTGNPYVMKEVKISNMSPAEKQQALTEVAVLKGCHHINIIRYKEAILLKDRGVLSIVMEHAECGDMYAAIKRQQGVYFNECEILGWFIQITLALQYIHNRNILHRDLKTQNLFLTAKKIIKIGDFGIARVLKEDKELATTAIGTPYYLSPEICQRKPYNSKSDMWALGCVLFEIAALVHPFQGQNFHQLVCAILKVQHKELPSHTGPLIQDLVSSLLSADPDRRPSADKILDIPALRPYRFNYYEYSDMQNSPFKYETQHSKYLVIKDKGLPSSVKYDGFRRFSADDVLADLSPPPPPIGKRSTSVSASQKGTAQTGVFKNSIPSLPSKEVASSVHKTPKSESKPRKRKAPNPQVESLIPRKLDTSNRNSGMKNPILRTYTLFKKAVGKNESSNTSVKKSPSRRQKKSISCDKDIDVSNYSVNTCHATQFLGNVASNTTDNHEPIENQQRAVEIHADGSLDDDVFVTSEKGTEMSNCATTRVNTVPADFSSPKCSHFTHCSYCTINILWKNRLTCRNNINEIERTKLRNHLKRVFGVEEYNIIYEILSDSWEDSCEDPEPMSDVLNTLSSEQQQQFPLFMQLVQLDVVSQPSSSVML